MRSSYPLRRSLPLSFISLLFLSVQFAHNANAQTLSDELQFVAVARNEPLAIDKLKFVGQQNTASQSPQEVATLESGKPIEREISGGQKHAYELALTKGQYANMAVEQRGVDVVVRLFGPDAKLMVEVDGESRPQGREILELVAATAGVYKLEIEPRYKLFPAGRYEIVLAELRIASEKDHELQEARRLFAQARQAYLAGKYDEAIQLGERSLTIREKILGPDHLETATTLFNLATACRFAADIPKAERLYLRALAIREKALGPDHLEVGLLLNNLGLMYYGINDYVSAEPLFERSVAIKEKVLGPDHPLTAFTFSNMGLLQWKKREYVKAVDYFQRALTIFEKSSGPESNEAATSAMNLGIVYKESGDYAKGEEYYQRALRVLEKIFGKDHPQVAFGLESLGILYRDKGDYATAEPLLQRDLAIKEKTLGPNHPAFANALGILARLYEAKGDVDRAVEFQTRAGAIEEKSIALNLLIGSERQKLAYFSPLLRATERRISLHVRSSPDNSLARELALTTILQRKGRVLDALADTTSALRRRLNDQDQALIDRLSDVTTQMARLILGGTQGMPVADHERKLNTLQVKREELEREISRRSEGLYQRAQPVTIDSVRQAIPENAALLEFAVYHPFDAKQAIEHESLSEPRYVVYVIRNQGEVRWTELGPAKDIETAVDAFRQALRDPQRRDVQQLARAVDKKVMQPVRALLGDATQLLISPDGELNLLPFAALADEQGRYLIQRYSFTYLTSGRDLLRMQVARESKSKPLLIANPLFGEPAMPLLAKTNAEVKPIAHNGRRRSITTGKDLSDVYFAPLDGTEQEARSIEKLFPDANLLTGAQATESAIKQVSAPRILHVATHGFFLSEPRAVAGGTRGSSPTVREGSVTIPPAVATGSPAPAATRSIGTSARIANPLLRSGLALSGANLRNSDSSDDGILTALEASGLNLWGTKLVVLSACDTGLGEVRNGEGVYGLRRAFVLAGAESLVMSLWPISDYTTRELMTNYYKNLEQGLGRGEALRQVQLDMLKKNPKLHPFYWANFIQSGEWANLDGKR